MRNIWVDESPFVRLTSQLKLVSVTSNAVSQIFVNSGRYCQSSNVVKARRIYTVNEVADRRRVCSIVQECHKPLPAVLRTSSIRLIIRRR